MTKVVQRSDVEKLNDELQKSKEYLERRVTELHEENRGLRKYRDEAEKRAAEIMGLNGQLVDLTRRCGILEGYKQRVEREDDLRHGRQEVRGDQ